MATFDSFKVSQPSFQAVIYWNRDIWLSITNCIYTNQRMIIGLQMLKIGAPYKSIVVPDGFILVFEWTNI